MLDWSYGYGQSEKNNKTCCKKCSKHRKLDLPYQDYCKEYNKMFSQNHIDDKIECEKFENNHKGV